MKKIRISFATGLLLFSLLFVYSGQEVFSQGQRSRDKVSFTLKQVKKWKNKITIKVNAKIQPGWILYGTRIKEGGPIPTTFSFPGKEVRLQQVVEIPRPKRKLDKGFNMVIPYHSGNASFDVKGHLLKDAKSIDMNVQFMACSDSICLAPDTITLKVKK